MQEHDPTYLEPTNRLRPRYDLPEPLSGGPRYRGLFSHGSFISFNLSCIMFLLCVKLFCWKIKFIKLCFFNLTSSNIMQIHWERLLYIHVITMVQM